MGKTVLSCMIACTLFGCREDTSKTKREQQVAPVAPSKEAPEVVEDVVLDEPIAEDPPNTSSLWKQYREALLSGEEPELADFSFAGYHWGEVPIPNAEWKVFDVTRAGAVPNDGKSDRKAIFLAIEAAEKNGSGIIYFPKGRFLINKESDPHNEPIIIKNSRIVLRGAGSGEGGTELFMERYMDPSDPKKLYSSPFMIQFKGEKPGGKKIRVVKDARRETRSIDLADATGFKVGDWVVLHLLNNEPEIVAAFVAPYTPDPAWKKLVNQGVTIDEFHYVISVSGNRLTFKEPIHVDLEVSEGWEVQRCNPLEEVGVEHIAFTGNWKEKFVHHKDAIHDGGWSMLQLSRCVNSWVRNCRFTDVSRVLSVTGSATVTVEDLLIDGNYGHNAVSLHGTSHCMVQRVDDRAGQWHAGGVAGPCSGNVFQHCSYPEDTCYESHASQPRWTLFDNISGGWKYGRWGGAEGSQPNHLHGLVLWNYENTGKGEPGEFHFMRPDSKYGRIIMPYVIGFHGNPQEWVKSEIKMLESNGSPVYPESLYEAQFELRRGTAK